MLGSASTQTVFASANSIALIPQVWVEWNHNMFTFPYVTNSLANPTTDATSKKRGGIAKLQLSKSTASWAGQYPWTDFVYSSSTVYRKTKTYTSSSAVTLTVVNKDYSNLTKSANFISSSYSLPYTYNGTLSSGGYRKIVFYAKAANVNQSTFTASATVPSASLIGSYNTTGSSVYQYMIISQGTNVSKSNEPWSYIVPLGYEMSLKQITVNDGSDVTGFTSGTNSGSVKLVWDANSSATSYKIYRRRMSYKLPSSSSYTPVTETFSYITSLGHNEIIELQKAVGVNQMPGASVTSNSSSFVFTDSIAKTFSTAYRNSPPAFNGTITINPRIIFSSPENEKDYASYNYGGLDGLDPLQFPSLVKSYDAETGAENFDSTSVTLYSNKWTKIEVWFKIPSRAGTGTYNVPTSFKLCLGLDAEYDFAQVAIDQIEMYALSEIEFNSFKNFSTSVPFKAFRPGEALLNPFLPQKDRTYVSIINNSYTKPSSFISKGVVTWGPNDSQSVTPFDFYSEYIAQDLTNPTTGNYSLQAFYDSYLSINKIVLKTTIYNQHSFSGSINIYQRSNYSSSVITTIPISNIDAVGAQPTIILYYDGVSWSTSSWSSPPKISTNGDLQSVMSEVDGIEIIATNPIYIGPSKNIPTPKFGIIEFSPRLEIDASDILKSVDVKKDLTSQQNDGFPFSYINANSANIVLSNIPVYKSDGLPGTIFENDSKNSTFYNMIRQGVKFTAFTKSPDFQKSITENIPMFTMYANSFSINDINEISITAYDSTKAIMQSNYSPQFFVSNGSLPIVVAAYLNQAGFSDYDATALNNLSKTVSQKITFWTDNTKSIFENLQNILVAFQIAAWVDEYGILRFKSLQQVFDNFNANTFSSDFAVTDINVSSGSAGTYIPNIIPDSFSQQIAERIGSVKINYKTPTRFSSTLVIGGVNSASNLPGETVGYTYPTANVWEELNSTAALSQFSSGGLLSFLPSVITPTSNYLYVDPKTLTSASGGSPKNVILNKDNLILGGEVIGYSGLEYKFWKANDPTKVMTRLIVDTSDITEAIQDYQINSGSVANDTASINYQLTGRIFNVKRGMYGTQRYNQYSSWFTTYSIAPNTASYVYAGAKNYLTSPVVSTSTTSKLYNFLAPTVKDKGFILYSVLFKSNAAITQAGKCFGIILNSTSTGYSTNSTIQLSASNNTSTFLEIRSTTVAAQQTVELYALTAAGVKQVIASSNTGPKNLFDGAMHSISIRPDYVNSGWMVYLDDHPALIINKSNVPVGVSLLPAAAAPYASSYLNMGSIYNIGRVWGVYAKEDAAVTTTTVVANFTILEIYARTKLPNENTSIIQSGKSHHWIDPVWLNSLVNQQQIPDLNYYYYSVSPDLRAIKIYETKFNNVADLYSGTPAIVLPEIPAVASAGNYSQSSASNFVNSDILSNNFSLKFAITTRNHNGLTWLNGNYLNSNGSNLAVKGYYLTQSEQKTITKAINPNSTRTVELSTDWFRDDAQAESVINSIAQASQGFNVDINVSVFGNPLIQVGDFAQITYSLKRVGYDPSDNTVTPLICLVTSVSYSLGSDGLSSTNLTLKPMITGKMV